MIPWVIYFFGSFSLGQLLSPLLSMLFIIFYPFSVLAMLTDFADLLDGVLVALLELDFSTIDVHMSYVFITLYSAILLMAIWSKKAFLGALIFSMLSVGIAFL
jgi:competence protein ComEC